jgi:hypothetical protein
MPEFCETAARVLIQWNASIKIIVIIVGTILPFTPALSQQGTDVSVLSQTVLLDPVPHEPLRSPNDWRAAVLLPSGSPIRYGNPQSKIS